jgi:hypothetical protein
MMSHSQCQSRQRFPSGKVQQAPVKAMRIEMTDRHSLQQIVAIEQMLDGRVKLSAKEALFVATQLVVHGSEWACEFVRDLSVQIIHPDAQQYLDRLSKQAGFIRGIPGLDKVRNIEPLRSELYKPEGIFFKRGVRHPEKLLVVFTTMFNNFYVSNLVFYALVRNFGVSVLLLKDSSLFNYLNGVVGFGGDIVQVSHNVMSLARREEVSEIYITGFSSGGYASLVSSCLLPCSRYLGFSVVSDLSRNSAIFSGKYFTDNVRGGIDQKWLVNLRDVLLGSSEFPKRDIFFGHDYKMDVEQAENLEGIPGTTIIGLNCGHQTIASLMESERLTSIFKCLLLESKDMLSDLSQS